MKKFFIFSIAGWLALVLAGCASQRDESVSQYYQDGKVTAEVKYALYQNPLTRNAPIHVETEKGVVQLSGIVDSHIQHELATEIARTTRGVALVQDGLVSKKEIYLKKSYHPKK